ncbi:hypothetical protein KKJ13_14330 [Xenorhabdus bovienii]|uniref:hypothetical protein n=1 Tax=Xenorhabdus bovienii TaxID=40576 RepID=UPI0023B24194|nr:hypothetical protein [Xenorhabdus bovienii]MDE9442751.1 hypothetical protein [Xenorhabdus bovienii]
MKYLVGLVIILFSVTAFSKQNELDFKAGGFITQKPNGKFNLLKIIKYRENYLPAFSCVIKFSEKQNVNNDFLSD